MPEYNKNRNGFVFELLYRFSFYPRFNFFFVCGKYGFIQFSVLTLFLNNTNRMFDMNRTPIIIFCNGMAFSYIGSFAKKSG